MADLSERQIDDRITKIIRLRPELVKRANRARRIRDQTFQKFAQEAIAREVAIVLDGAEAEREARAAERAETGPRGLGIRERLEAEEAARAKRREPPEPPVPAPAAPVVVNVGTAAGGAVSDVGPLARMVAESPDRRAAMESACRILAQGRSREEALQVADQLTAAVKRIDAAPATALERVRARAEARKR